MTSHLLRNQIDFGFGDRPGARAARPLVRMQRLFTILGVLVVAGAILFALFSYSHQKAAVRQAETERYLGAFETGPVADAWARLSLAWSKERPRQQALLDHFRTQPDQAVLSDYRYFILESIDERQLEDEIGTVFNYFRVLALCVQVGNCDGRRTAAYFGELPWTFRNQHFLYLSEAYHDVPFDFLFETIAPQPKDDELQLHGP